MIIYRYISLLLFASNRSHDFYMHYCTPVDLVLKVSLLLCLIFYYHINFHLSRYASELYYDYISRMFKFSFIFMYLIPSSLCIIFILRIFSFIQKLMKNYSVLLLFIFINVLITSAQPEYSETVRCS